MISWQDVLAQAGYPTTVVTIDFETYFDSVYGLKALSVIEYIKDSRFEILGTAVRTGEGVSQWHIRPDWVWDIDWDNVTVLAQNARFDLSILLQHFNILPKYHVDLMAVCRHVHPQNSAKLADMATFYGLAPKGDTSQFRGATRRERWTKQKGRGKASDKMVRQPCMTREQEQALKEYACHDADLEFDLFTRMLPRFSRPRIELPLQQHTTEQFLLSRLRVDKLRAERIRRDMLNMVSTLCEAAGVTPEKVSKNGWFKEELVRRCEAANVKPPLKHDAKGKVITATAKTDPEFEAFMEHWNEPIRTLMQARVAVRAWPTKAKRVHNLIKQADANGGYLPVPLNYHGAHTGRWSGGEGINLQNLGSRGHALDAEVRNVLLPPPGHKMVIVDQAAVEARGTAWVAGQNDLLQEFRDGVDVYCSFASHLFPFTVRRPEAGDPEPVASRLKAARNCGKVGVLGGGYGMGPVRCQDYASDFGLTFSFEEASNVINTYRTRYPKIVQFWKDIYEGFKWTYKTNRPSTVGCLRIYADLSEESEDVVIVLPSGRELRYANVAEQMADRGPELVYYSERTRKWSKIYGGYLTENIVQGLCRDTLAEAVLDLEKQGIRIPLTVHDEIVAVAPAKDADRVLDVVTQRLRRSPAWGVTLPLDAEGHIADYYEK